MRSDIKAWTFSRVIGVLLFAVLPLALFTLSAVNVIAISETSAALEEKKVLLARLQDRVRLLASLPSDTARAGQLYVEGNSQSLAGATLRQRVVAAVAAAQGKLIETRTRDDVQPVGNAISLNVTFDIGNEGLAHLMYDLETGLPLLGVESVTVRKSVVNETEADTDPTLRVDILVSANWRPELP